MLLLVAIAAAPLLTSAQEKPGEVLGQWRQIPARYLIHSGGATYPEPPTKADSALTVLIEGKPAQEIFDRIGPDSQERCSSAQGDRERTNKGVSCSYTAKLNDPKDFHYRCWIGINLRTGDGDVRISC